MNAHVNPELLMQPATLPEQTDFAATYSPIDQLCFEVRMLLALAHLDELAGDGERDLRHYQQAKVRVLIERVQ
ncbi:MAG: hypothetical protein AB7P20_19210 [Rhizobiaceae bacterium]